MKPFKPNRLEPNRLKKGETKPFKTELFMESLEPNQTGLS